MITGIVSSRQAIVEVAIEGTNGSAVSVLGVIDTGYNGELTLPPHVIRSLGFPSLGHRGGRLADGTALVTKMYRGTVRWLGGAKVVLIAELTGTPLIGMSLLSGCRLTIDGLEDGQVLIENLQ